MSKYEIIIAKLERFIKKFYVNELLKGVILFFATGLLYFLLTVSFEFFFWLGKTGRLILFWLFVAVELGLFLRFILYPLLKLLKLSSGISYDQAARIIGVHFPEVDDKLLNVLQLKKAEEKNNSELLLAGIEQKSTELQPVPFRFAISFTSNIKYLKYAAIPVLIVLAIWISGQSSLFSSSYSRMVNYDMAYAPPAPFSFEILNPELQVRENQSFELRVKTHGKMVPENVKINYNGETYLLQSDQTGKFHYTFDRLKDNLQFFLSANKVHSPSYHLNVIQVPSLLSFKMKLDYPTYVKKSNKTINGNGNATIPEGTEIQWLLHTKTTDEVSMELPDTTRLFTKNAADFSLNQTIYRNTPYQITTSNEQIKEYEKLSYRLKVVKDQYPEIKVDMKRDTLNGEKLYFKGQVSDDYGLSRLQLVYYPVKDKKQTKRRLLLVSSGNFDQFVYAFPDTLNLSTGTSYELYFQVFDNDKIHGSKSTKSQFFSFRKLTEDERERKQLQEQKNTMEGMNKTLKKMKSSNQQMEELNQMQKEKSQLNYNDRQKFNNFLERQQTQNQLMKEYSKKMKKDLDDFQKKEEENDDFKKKLKERMERQEKRLEKNEELMKELEKYRNKLSKEDMAKQLEKMAKQRNKQQRNLEELLELTKRYYVQKKTESLAEDLKKLAERQKALSKKDEDNTSEKQKKLNKEFEDFQKELEKLEKENQGLKHPMDLERDQEKEAAIQKEQEEATNKLEKSEQQTEAEEQEEAENGNSDSENQKENDQGNSDEENTDQPKTGEQMKGPAQKMKSGAQQKQQSAGKKMQQMSQQMQQSMQMGQQEQMQEDVKMLRQILDNLIVFSFQQEDLMIDFKDMNWDSPDFGKKLKYQHVLKENFHHIDDSLYALALRNPFISDKITNKLTDIDYNIDKSLDRLAQNKLNTGAANQQYVLTGANDLANMLDSALQNMEMMMQQSSGGGQGQGVPMPGEGEGRGFQLPDIIKEQEALGEAMKKDKKNSQEKGEDGEEGKGGGNKGQEPNGESGQNGKGKGQQNGEGQVPGNEQMSQQIYEIYKRQQKIRMELEDLIRKNGWGEESKRLRNEMEHIEQDLLRQGMTKQTQQMMMRVQQQLMKLQQATYTQQQENKRESRTSKKVYQNTHKSNLEKAKDYFQTTEILNRQSLPLQPDYKIIVQDYFKGQDD